MNQEFNEETKEISEELKQKLKFLANKFETVSFYDEDPSQFLNHYENQNETEIASFIAALLSFGSRKQFIPKIKFIFSLADKKGGILEWIKSREFLSDFQPESKDLSEKFYRFYSWKDLQILFEETACLLEQSLAEKSKGFGETVKKSYEKKLSLLETKNDSSKTSGTMESSGTAKSGETIKSAGEKAKFPNGNSSSKTSRAEILSSAIQEFFPKSKIVPKGKNSANKRIYMFLRWMVRADSKVDKGFWLWFSPSDLIIPLDTHVMQESVRLGLIPEKSACSIKTAKLLTDKLKEIWKDDPCKGDFALFGLGVSDDEKQTEKQT